jgi:predicted nucleic-acid-binding Zn-ribbon protein
MIAENYKFESSRIYKLGKTVKKLIDIEKNEGLKK